MSLEANEEVGMKITMIVNISEIGKAYNKYMINHNLHYTRYIEHILKLYSVKISFSNSLVRYRKF